MREGYGHGISRTHKAPAAEDSKSRCRKTCSVNDADTFFGFWRARTANLELFGEYEIRRPSGLGTIDFSLAPDEALINICLDDRSCAVTSGLQE